MCGLTGVLSSEHMKVDESCLQQMNDALLHRGPDGAGRYSEHGIDLGHRRLSIIDLATGAQPVSNESGTIWAAFNGEIYNYVELRASLQAKGHIFKTHSDTEVIVHQYEDDGERCVEKFVGMFAIAIWDARMHRLLLARDRYGVKPLFVAELPYGLAFASEMKSLFKLPQVDLSWNPAGLNSFLHLDYIPAPLTAYRGIRKFAQGTTETWEVDGSGRPKCLSMAQYWTPNLDTPGIDVPFDDAMKKVFSLLQDSVRIRLRSDVPLGAFLSGGIDSSSVVALMRLCGADRIKTFSIGYEESEFDETGYANQVARLFQTDHHCRIVTGEDALSVVPLLSDIDEPFADSSFIPTYLVSKLAREHVTVSLSGDGSDELFGGYDKYYRIGRYQYVDTVPLPVRRQIADAAAFLVKEGMIGGGFVRRLGVPSRLRWMSLRSHGGDDQAFRSLSTAFSTFLKEPFTANTWEARFHSNHSVSSAQLVDQQTYLPDDILVKLDRASMAVSLEARVPFLDHKLAEYVNSLHSQYKVQGKQTKVLLKRIMSRYLPQEILRRKKMGFGIPLRKWLCGPLADHLERSLGGNSSGLFAPDQIRTLLRALGEGNRDISNQAWKLMVLANWADSQKESKNW